MVLHVNKYDMHPDKMDAYLKWTEGAIKRALAVPGLIEFRAYRAVTGSSQLVITYEFADLAAWAVYNSNPEVQKLQLELRTLALNITSEVWGPSPVVPVPIRPGK